tara:strand:- start:3041 stop:3214 length:174 start_codon:yes stop_codon:yes gene_type:complete
MRENLRSKTKYIYFKIINATAKAAGDEHVHDKKDYVIDRKRPSPLSLPPNNSRKSRY